MKWEAYDDFMIEEVLVISAVVVNVIGRDAKHNDSACPMQKAGEKDEGAQEGVTPCAKCHFTYEDF
jgi:hypothetical protein